MTEWIVPALLTCVPFLLTIYAWMRICKTRPLPGSIGLAALVIATVNTTIAVAAFLILKFESLPYPPPWKDTGTLTLALLILLAPIGMGFGLLAGVGGSPKWLVVTVEIAQVPLAIVGFFACLAV
jgi:hypothetical protein